MLICDQKHEMKKISAIIWMLLFVVFAIYQSNDPDPIIWISIYGAAALLSLLVLMNKVARPVLYVAMFLFLIGAWLLWPESFEGLFLLEDGSYTPSIEEARESLGLFIGALSMAWHIFISKAGVTSKS
ncbi:MAG: hypothetical protein DHS20C17_09510 [Cyclobacteriaceae bacterium]|nr:MAG: hypothetical protein DHS20C17_09510 [Cyclobacteriaceae bacterium]